MCEMEPRMPTAHGCCRGGAISKRAIWPALLRRRKVREAYCAWARQATDSCPVEPGAIKVHAGDLVEEVLADLVGQSVITQDQSDAIVAALEAVFEERHAEAEAA